MRLAPLALLLLSCGTSSAPAPAPAPAPTSAPGSAAPRQLSGPTAPAVLAKPLPPPPPTIGPADLGNSPRPFGALAELRAGMGRADVRRLVPGATVERDGLAVDLGLGGLRGNVRFTHADHLDWLQVDAWPGVEDQFEAAWGKPRGPAGAPYWLSPIIDGTGWRADVGQVSGGPRAAVVSIGPYVSFASLLSRHGDGLARPNKLIGARIEDLRRTVPDLLEAVTPRSGQDDEGATRYRLQLPATEVCRYFTTVDLSVDANGRVDDATLRICYADDAARDAARRVMVAAWDDGDGDIDPARLIFEHGDRWIIASPNPDEVDANRDGEADDDVPHGAWLVGL